MKYQVRLEIKFFYLYLPYIFDFDWRNLDLKNQLNLRLKKKHLNNEKIEYGTINLDMILIENDYFKNNKNFYKSSSLKQPI